MRPSQLLQNGLVALGKSVYLRKPTKGIPGDGKGPTDLDVKTASVNAPSLILIFGWMGAQLPHVLKYSNAYCEIYPYSTQIIVKSEASYFWSSEKTRKASVKPVVDTLEALGCLPPFSSSTSKLLREADVQPIVSCTAPSVLVHAFSNGGAWQLTAVGELLSSRTYPSTTKLAPTALVLDSCPGDGGVDGTINAFSGLVRNPILRSIVVFMIRLLYSYASFRRKLPLSSSENVFERLKARLNNDSLLPWFTKDTPRLYVYSATDNVIPHREVEKHIEEAKRIGLNVRLERFEDSKHVAHARADPERYWTAVKKLWEDASSRGESG